MPIVGRCDNFCLNSTGGSCPGSSIFYHAPALVLVLARSDESQAKEDCCLAAQVFMLAAREAGLGTCWIGFGRPWLNLPATKVELGLPQNYHVVAPIVLGFPQLRIVSRFDARRAHTLLNAAISEYREAAK